MTKALSGHFRWRKSTWSANECVEVAHGRRSIFIRDTKERAGDVLAFRPDGWQAFLVAVKGDRLTG